MACLDGKYPTDVSAGGQMAEARAKARGCRAPGGRRNDPSDVPRLRQRRARPVQIKGLSTPGVTFDYTDAYSVFDWGKMPDALTDKGASLAMIAADWFEKLERADTWKEFSKSQDALALRSGNRFGSAFNELGEQLQKEGLRTHYLGVPSGNNRSGNFDSSQWRDRRVRFSGLS